MISLLSGQSEKIYMVFPNEHLMKRDQAEFEPLITVSSMGEEKVTYRVGLKDFKPEPNALIIVDEIDVFLLDEPIEFKAIIANNACIGLTATTAGTAMEKQVAKALEFKERSYSFGDSEAIANAEILMVDENITAATIADKVSYIQ
jgi:superfamily II DNA or RNA helicase